MDASEDLYEGGSSNIILEKRKNDGKLEAAKQELPSSFSAGGSPDPDHDPDEEEKEWKRNPSKAESKIWKELKPHKGKTKTNGLKGKSQRFYEWDYTHNDIEVFNGGKRHLGSMDPKTGEMIKPPVPGRMLR